ncbi:hypothetical protein WR25_10300 [Diploscapter pachys]|uniref:CX domain-containing protein n=1 Tax=Diploscapter pachys TaxID=2018661 RepID=A0A2A2KY83_9BILA|nr:hypothetical protein WR25_10300 [Diploscapter pachys]
MINFATAKVQFVIRISSKEKDMPNLNYCNVDSNRNVRNQMCIYGFDYEDVLSKQASQFRNCTCDANFVCTYSDRQIGDEHKEEIRWNKMVYKNGTEIRYISYGCMDNELCCGLECCEMINSGLSVGELIFIVLSIFGILGALKLAYIVLVFFGKAIVNCIPTEAKSYLENKWDSFKETITCGFWKKPEDHSTPETSSEVVDETQQAKAEDPSNSEKTPSTADNNLFTERAAASENGTSLSSIDSEPDPDPALLQHIRNVMAGRPNKRQSKQRDDSNTEANSTEMQQLKPRGMNPSRENGNGEDGPTTSSSGSIRQTQSLQDEERQPLLGEDGQNQKPSTSMPRKSSSDHFDLVDDSTTKGREEEM